MKKRKERGGSSRVLIHALTFSSAGGRWRRGRSSERNSGERQQVDASLRACNFVRAEDSR